MTHSETLMPMIDTCLKMCGMTCADIDLYGVNAGPGSFTGCASVWRRSRVWPSRGKRCAHRFPRWKHWPQPTPARAPCCAHWMPAVRRYTVPRLTLPPTSRLLDDDARAVADLADFVENCKKPLFFVGDGASLCYNKYGSVPGVLQAPPALRGGRAAAVGPCGKADGRSWKGCAAGGSAAGLPPPESGRAGSAQSAFAAEAAANAAQNKKTAKTLRD